MNINPLFTIVLPIYFQEVTLERASTEEKVGLTLCYGSAEDDITDIFISEVSTQSKRANIDHIILKGPYRPYLVVIPKEEWEIILLLVSQSDLKPNPLESESP